MIDTVGYNDKFWMDSRGTPHTEQMHTIERWTRTSYGTMTNDFTLDDPGAFSRPVQLKFTAKAAAARIGADGVHLHREQPVRHRVGHRGSYREKGFGLEVKPGEITSRGLANSQLPTSNSQGRDRGLGVRNLALEVGN